MSATCLKDFLDPNTLAILDDASAYLDRLVDDMAAWTAPEQTIHPTKVYNTRVDCLTEYASFDRSFGRQNRCNSAQSGYDKYIRFLSIVQFEVAQVLLICLASSFIIRYSHVAHPIKSLVGLVPGQLQWCIHYGIPLFPLRHHRILDFEGLFFCFSHCHHLNETS